jgi:hypothetical protein
MTSSTTGIDLEIKLCIFSPLFFFLFLFYSGFYNNNTEVLANHSDNKKGSCQICQVIFMYARFGKSFRH